MLEFATALNEGKESFEFSRRKCAFESIHDMLQPPACGRRRNINPIASHTANAAHSAPVKCPGIAGTSFINTSNAETTTPKIVAARSPALFVTKKNERHAANHPSAEAIEPTSVTGTSSASPSNKQASVAIATATMATMGV